MGEINRNMNKLIYCKKLIILFLIFNLITISSISIYSGKTSINNLENNVLYDKLIKQIELKPGEDFFIRFISEDVELECENVPPVADSLSTKIKNAIAKSPRWIQNDLAKQFHLIDGEDYANLILSSEKIFVDEIAFSIAYSSFGDVPTADLLTDNVKFLYENDKLIQYADIIDLDEGDGNYYSTIIYRVIEDNIEKEFELPPEIYYWYIVHPEAAGEKPKYVYDSLWRDYLFNHNDIGYPLLKEKISDIQYLWNNESYFQMNNRTWKWSMDNHPTAIEAVSYWIGKTVNTNALGDRPGQPNIISHEHNGFCGELQRIAVAALRSVLVPSVAVSNIGEDHVWREFYERGWHENDNWWADTGGAVDMPDVYTYNWGKDISGVFAWKGDDSIYEVTHHYIHPEDRCTINFKVLDSNFKPVDGARVTCMVKWPADFTSIKHDIWNFIEKIWDFIPDILKGRILQNLYSRIKEKITSLPNTVDMPVTSIWNYTNMDGICSFELGRNREYIFFIQYGNLKNPWELAKYNKIRIFKIPEDKTYDIYLPFLKNEQDKHISLESSGDKYSFEINFDSFSYQIQKSPLWINDKGFYKKEGKVDFFIVDKENLDKYQQDLFFICFEYLEKSEGDISFNSDDKDYYFIFKNNGKVSNVFLNLTIELFTDNTEEKVKFVSPFSNVFEKPIFNIGDKILFEGIATDDIILLYEETNIDIVISESEWNYLLDTSDFEPGEYLFTVKCGDASDELSVILIDVIIPEIIINSPYNMEIFDRTIQNILIAGKCNDNYDIDYVEVSIDNSQWKKAEGIVDWDLYWDISTYDLGEHKISVKAIDNSGMFSIENLTFIINDSSQIWGPIIIILYHKPLSPFNMSNIIIYADVNCTSPFSIQKIVAFWDDGSEVKSSEMWEYGNHPIQERHEEDPLKHLPNKPIYGLELGQFSSDTKLNYWIEAYDTANNNIISEKNKINII
jgi:hypothetical protein